ncbi:MAG TPA: DNA-3-methyladenine glycosylase I [Ktedonobacterales bacterium]|nr:DNA-3-methyladenine glycosylase I [Ktedonobacterales bacterium]
MKIVSTTERTVPEREGMRERCVWAGNGANHLMLDYHDTEWGVPVHDDRRLFEFLLLEGAQAGLSWSTILNKRNTYALAFDNFDPARIARYDESRCQALLANSGIIRNRAKITAAVKNARAFLAVQDRYGSFDDFVWRFVGGRPIPNTWASAAHVPARTPESDALSRELRRLDFSFAGSTICYAFMQAVGMVNDHLVQCFRWSELHQS